MKTVFVTLCAVLLATFSEACDFQNYSKDNDVKIPLADQDGKPAEVTVMQYFELPRPTKATEVIAIDCVSILFSSTTFWSSECIEGDIVVMSSTLQKKPSRVIALRPRVLCPYGEKWNEYDNSFRMKVDANQNGIFIGYQTNSTKDAFTIFMAAKKTATPATKLWIHMNTTKQWEDLSGFYAHGGMSADIVMP